MGLYLITMSHKVYKTSIRYEEKLSARSVREYYEGMERQGLAPLRTG